MTRLLNAPRGATPGRPLRCAEGYVLACVSSSRWVGEPEVATGALGAPGLALSDDGLVVHGLPLPRVLRGLRRRGWVIYSNELGAWRRTPSGTRALVELKEVLASA